MLVTSFREAVDRALLGKGYGETLAGFFVFIDLIGPELVGENSGFRFFEGCATVRADIVRYEVILQKKGLSYTARFLSQKQITGMCKLLMKTVPLPDVNV